MLDAYPKTPAENVAFPYTLLQTNIFQINNPEIQHEYFASPDTPPLINELRMFELESNNVLIVTLLFYYPVISATQDAALMLPQIFKLFIEIYFAKHEPIIAATYISPSEQVDFQFEAKLIYILLNEPIQLSTVKTPIVPKLENQPFPDIEQLIFVQLCHLKVTFSIYYVSNFILKYFSTSNADDKFQQATSRYRSLMNYSLTLTCQNYVKNRIRSSPTIWIQCPLFQKVKVEIATCNQRKAMTKTNAVEDVWGSLTNPLN
ncbi:Hypothetical_protein [Hexamita inflata]|uniref:Hypothetical_protein n=1 Tax=Hexamita inflata TaxID=28002 RepID=A0AA86P5S7_9EUKA|nr:Hypothetical protein HINF_LOCUS20382 [Hexamita inflata]